MGQILVFSRSVLCEFCWAQRAKVYWKLILKRDMFGVSLSQVETKSNIPGITENVSYLWACELWFHKLGGRGKLEEKSTKQNSHLNPESRWRHFGLSLQQNSHFGLQNYTFYRVKDLIIHLFMTSFLVYLFSKILISA